jgi:hypothetical protein
MWNSWQRMPLICVACGPGTQVRMQTRLERRLSNGSEVQSKASISRPHSRQSVLRDGIERRSSGDAVAWREPVFRYTHARRGAARSQRKLVAAWGVSQLRPGISPGSTELNGVRTVAVVEEPARR